MAGDRRLVLWLESVNLLEKHECEFDRLLFPFLQNGTVLCRVVNHYHPSALFFCGKGGLKSRSDSKIEEGKNDMKENNSEISEHIAIDNLRLFLNFMSNKYQYHIPGCSAVDFYREDEDSFNRLLKILLHFGQDLGAVKKLERKYSVSSGRGRSPLSSFVHPSEIIGREYFPPHPSEIHSPPITPPRSPGIRNESSSRERTTSHSKTVMDFSFQHPSERAPSISGSKETFINPTPKSSSPISIEKHPSDKSTDRLSISPTLTFTQSFSDEEVDHVQRNSRHIYSQQLSCTEDSEQDELDPLHFSYKHGTENSVHSDCYYTDGSNNFNTTLPSTLLALNDTNVDFKKIKRKRSVGGMKRTSASITSFTPPVGSFYTPEETVKGNDSPKTREAKNIKRMSNSPKKHLSQGSVDGINKRIGILGATNEKQRNMSQPTIDTGDIAKTCNGLLSSSSSISISTNISTIPSNIIPERSPSTNISTIPSNIIPERSPSTNNVNVSPSANNVNVSSTASSNCNSSTTSIAPTITSTTAASSPPTSTAASSPPTSTAASKTTTSSSTTSSTNISPNSSPILSPHPAIHKESSTSSSESATGGIDMSFADCGMKAIARWPYAAQKTDELSFQRKDIINLTNMAEEEWWEGRIGDQFGWFPDAYVTAFESNEDPPELSSSEEEDDFSDCETSEILEFLSGDNDIECEKIDTSDSRRISNNNNNTISSNNSRKIEGVFNVRGVAKYNYRLEATVEIDEEFYRQTVEELLHSEYYFLEKLDNYHDNFLKPLLNLDGIGKDIVPIFVANFPDLINFHSRMYDEMLAMFESEEETNSWGSFFLEKMKSMISVYKTFASNTPYAIHCFRNLRTTEYNVVFEGFLQQKAKVLDIEAKIIVPVSMNAVFERIKSYNFFLKDIARHTADNNEDKPNLVSVVNNLEHLFDKCAHLRKMKDYELLILNSDVESCSYSQKLELGTVRDYFNVNHISPTKGTLGSDMVVIIYNFYCLIIKKQTEVKKGSGTKEKKLPSEKKGYVYAPFHHNQHHSFSIKDKFPLKNLAAIPFSEDEEFSETGMKLALLKHFLSFSCCSPQDRALCLEAFHKAIARAYGSDDSENNESKRKAVKSLFTKKPSKEKNSLTGTLRRRDKDRTKNQQSSSPNSYVSSPSLTSSSSPMIPIQSNPSNNRHETMPNMSSSPPNPFIKSAPRTKDELSKQRHNTGATSIKAKSPLKSTRSLPDLTSLLNAPDKNLVQNQQKQQLRMMKNNNDATAADTAIAENIPWKEMFSMIENLTNVVSSMKATVEETRNYQLDMNKRLETLESLIK